MERLLKTLKIAKVTDIQEESYVKCKQCYKEIWQSDRK